MAIGSYQSEEVREKPSKVRTGEQSTRRLDAVILAEPSLWRLACLSSNNLLVFCEFRPFNCKGDEQNWHEFNVRCMVDVKIGGCTKNGLFSRGQIITKTCDHGASGTNSVSLKFR